MKKKRKLVKSISLTYEQCPETFNILNAISLKVKRKPHDVVRLAIESYSKKISKSEAF